MKKIISVILVCVLMLSVLTGCGKTSMDDILKDTNMVIGTVDGQDVYAYEMIYYLKQGASLEEAKDVIIQTKVFLNLAKEHNIEFTDEMQTQVDSFMADQEAQLGSREALESATLELGISVDQFTSLYKDAVMTQEVVNKIVESGVVKEATDEEAKEFFNTYCLKAKHILFSTLKEDGVTALGEEEALAKLDKANETLKLIDGGADFDSFANLNEDPGSQQMPDGYVFVNTSIIEDPALLSTVQQAGLAMVKEFETTAVELEPGQVSSVVTTQFGHHIVKRVEISDTDFEEYKQTIRGVLTNLNFSIFIENEENEADVKWEESAVEALGEGVTPLQQTAQQ